MNVEIYSKPDCSLCDEAKAVLLRVQQKIPFELQEVNIERDPALYEKYKHDIPVVFVDGKKFFKHKVDEEQLVARLERSRSFNMGTLDPRKTLSRASPVSRGTKIGFALLFFALFGGILANKVYQVFIEPDRAALSSVEVEKLDQAAPPAEWHTESGEVLKLADLRGKTVFLNFWATWCGPCREEMPSMAQLAASFGGRQDFVMVAVSVDESWDPVKKFFGDGQPGFKVVRDENAAWAKRFGTTQFPETWIIGKDGNIKAHFVGARDWSERGLRLYFKKLLDGEQVARQQTPAERGT